MQQRLRRGTAILLIMACLFFPACRAGKTGSPSLAGDTDLPSLVAETAAYILAAVPSPEQASVGGEWAVLGLARSGETVPEGWFQGWYARLEEAVRAKEGVLHRRKYTEYSLAVLTLSSVGKDPRYVAGYDLLLPLGDYEQVIWQGLNGPIWALIALDSANYPMPQNPDAKTQATRQMYVDCILGEELDEGGWTLARRSSTDSADPDITGMALQALAKYQDQEKVAAAIDRALSCMSKKQDGAGGFSSWGSTNCESAVQVLVALCELGIGWNDERFVKNGHTLLDNILSFRTASGGFRHVMDGSTGDDQLTAEQGFYGLVAALRFEQGRNSLYRMGDAISISEALTGEARAPGTGLAGKNKNVTPTTVKQPGITFSDITNSPNKAAIEALAAREIITGTGDGTFAPDAVMTRAQYADAVVRALGLTSDAAGASAFTDVPPNAWYAAVVGTANTYNIIKGISDKEFSPNGSITRQEAAVMTVRAAKLCGLDTALRETEITDILCDFADYRSTDSWAWESMAWCYKTGVLDDAEQNVEPKREILRGEVAEMLYRMLVLANLI